MKPNGTPPPISAPPEGTRWNWRFLLRLGVSLGAVVLVLAWVDLPVLGRLLIAASPVPMLLMLVLIVGDRVLMAYKWWLLLRILEPQIGWWRSLGAYYGATLAGLFLPSTLGGDIVRTLSLRRSGVKTVNMAASIVLERILGMLPAGLMALGSLFLLHAYGRDNAGLAALVTALLLCLVGGSLALSFWAPGLAALERASWPRLRAVGKTLAQWHHAYQEFHHRAPVLFGFVALSLIEQGFPIAITALAAWALGVRIPLVYLLAALPPVLLFSRLPISVGGLGVQEGSFIYMLSLFGIASTQALSVILLSNALLILSLLPVATWYFIESPPRAGTVPPPPRGVVRARGGHPPGSDPG